MRIIIDIIVIILLCRSCLIMILPSEKSATDVAAQCFLNALIRETKAWQLAERIDYPAGRTEVAPFQSGLFLPNPASPLCISCSSGHGIRQLSCRLYHSLPAYY